MANLNDQPSGATTERAFAPATTPRGLLPHEMEVERVGGLSSGVANIFPGVRGGVCERCGVIDPNVPSQYQYKLCQHYRGKQLACSYCPTSKDVDDVIGHSVLRIMQHPEYPNKLLIHCDSYDCLNRHRMKWQLAAN